MDISEPSSSPPAITVQDSDSESVITTSQMILDAAEASTTATQVDPEVIVASGDTQYTRKRLRLVNNLHDIGLDHDIPLPIIAVIGSQSSGKSSLIHATSGVPLPKAPGDACTRCPIECRLMRGETWSCRVYLRRNLTPELSKEPFGDDITDRDSVKDRVERAQLAILNPSLPAETFLDDNIDLRAPAELSFSSSIVCLEITGPEYSDISFIDLPGLIRNVGTSGNRNNIQLIEDLAATYISKSNCIILMTITCETDFANQGAYGLACEHDPRGFRTVGVLTKPDRSPETAHEKWVRFVRGETEQLRHGWFCVKLHDTETRHPQPTLREAREQEEQWFNKESVWGGLRARSHLGTKKLVHHLEEILSEVISTRLVDLDLQIRELEEQTASELESLGKPPSDDSIGDINAIIDQLVYGIELGIERRGREEGRLLYLIEDEAIAMKKKLRETCPDFRAWTKATEERKAAEERKGTKERKEESTSFTPIPDILLEEGDPPADKGTREIIYLDDIIKKKTRSSARGLPDGGQSEVAEGYLRSITAKWAKPTDEFVKGATDALKIFIKKAIEVQCEHLSYGGLHNDLMEAIDGHLKECLATTQTAIKMLLKLERSGHTRNDCYYREYKDKFLTHFKLQRELTSPTPLLRNLNNMASPNGNQPHAQFVNHINQAISALGKAGFPGIEALQLAKLLASQASDPALEDMAAACAGFEVALHRFVDYVPLIVDTELVQGVCQGLATILRKSFRFNDPGAAERCSAFLRESVEVRERREFLKQRKHRLALAKVELTEYGFWTPSQ
ncbi:P-loop containing nucleoside triphosphate hydrolase protein [Russula emetica]|nr:P-loop containing nucleoside triphosphate hydrolase protein [Russula emetica]